MNHQVDTHTTQGKVVLITGSSRGIGACTARLLAQQGYRIVVNYARNHQEAGQVVRDIEASGGIARAFQADISDPAQVHQLFNDAVAAYGKVDVLINNAGIMDTTRIQMLDNVTVDRILDINLKGALYAMREAAARLEPGGKIINLSSSVTGLHLEGYGLYTASKAAIESLTAILAKELRGRNITVNAIAPGPTATELFFEGKTEEVIDRLKRAAPLERLGTVEDIAAVIVFAVSDASNWINAQILRVNGGMI